MTHLILSLIASSICFTGFAAPISPPLKAISKEPIGSAAVLTDGIVYEDVFLIWSDGPKAGCPFSDAELDYYAQQTVNLAADGHGSRITIKRFRGAELLLDSHEVPAFPADALRNYLSRQQAKDQAFDALKAFLRRTLQHIPYQGKVLEIDAALNIASVGIQNRTGRYRSLILCLSPGNYVRQAGGDIVAEPVYRSGQLLKYSIGLYLVGKIDYSQHNYLWQLQQFERPPATFFTDKKRAVR